MLRRAVVWRLIAVNPVAATDRPRLRRAEVNVLSEAEVARLWTAYTEAREAADDQERPWWRLAHVLADLRRARGGTASRRADQVVRPSS